jgi:hypothetical protein
MDTCSISVGIGQFMMQVAQLGPNLRLLAEMRSGAGLLQGQKIRWNYKVDSRRSLGGDDVPIWKNSTGKYNCANTWNALREKEPRVDWWKAVWHPVAIPSRHSFMLWLVFKGALVTRERMCRWGYIGDCLCLFCRGCIESSDHLFFKCGFSKRIWKKLMKLCHVENPFEDWDDIRAWCGTVLTRDCFNILCLGAATYHIWKQRNAILHSNSILTEEAIIGRIKWEVKARMIAKGNFQRSMENSRLATLWNLT